jgi:UDP-N-acetylmuramyl pentapeptide phosphotransferase/UDP-N-acetylglucosamine-1-phosphate transferase
MDSIIIGGLISFIVSFYAMPIIIQVAEKKKLYDLPGERKVHKTPIPSLGGLGIFIGFTLGMLLSINLSPANNVFQYYMAAFLVVFFFGIKDDILVLAPMKKLMGQLFVAGILIFKAGLVIDNMHGFATITEINPIVSKIFTAATIVVIMNAYNLIDGVDGLAATVGILTTSIFAVFFYLNGDMFYAIMGLTFAASLVAFLIYNYSPAKIFMGDTGSMMIGAVNAIMVIHFIQTAEGSGMLPVLASPAMGFGILMLPLLDTLRVFSLRIMRKRSPFSPDRTHLHHLLLDKGFSHRAITLSIGSFVLLFIVASYLALFMGATKVIVAQVVLFFLGIYLLNARKLLAFPRKPAKKAVTLIENEDQYADSIFNPTPGTGIFAKRAEPIEEEDVI